MVARPSASARRSKLEQGHQRGAKNCAVAHRQTSTARGERGPNEHCAQKPFSKKGNAFRPPIHVAFRVPPGPLDPVPSHTHTLSSSSLVPRHQLVAAELLKGRTAREGRGDTSRRLHFGSSVSIRLSRPETEWDLTHRCHGSHVRASKACLGNCPT